MRRFIEGADRTQVSLLPGCVEDYVEAENPVRVIDAFVEQLDLRAMGFEGADPEATGRPAYHPLGATQDLSLRLPVPSSVKPATRAGNSTQPRTDVVDWAVDARLQDDC